MLKNYLRTNKISIYRLSKESKIPYTTLNDLVNGETDIEDISLKVFVKLSIGLKMSLEELYKILDEKEEIRESFYRYFWDTDIDKLDTKINKNYIIGRLLDKGDLEAFNYVFDNYSKKEIIDFAKNSRNMNKKIANFLSNYFNINKKEMVFYKFCNNDWR